MTRYNIHKMPIDPKDRFVMYPGIPVPVPVIPPPPPAKPFDPKAPPTEEYPEELELAVEYVQFGPRRR
jgi:hypothetical protein